MMVSKVSGCVLIHLPQLNLDILERLKPLNMEAFYHSIGHTFSLKMRLGGCYTLGISLSRSVGA